MMAMIGDEDHAHAARTAVLDDDGVVLSRSWGGSPWMLGCVCREADRDVAARPGSDQRAPAIGAVGRGLGPSIACQGLTRMAARSCKTVTGALQATPCVRRLATFVPGRSRSGWATLARGMYFDEFKHQLPDIDPAETEDWLDSLDQVVDAGGRARPVHRSTSC